MNRKKKDIKIYFLVSLFIFLIFISTIPATNNLHIRSEKGENEIIFNKEKEDSPSTSDLDLTDYFTGKGVNQAIRLFMENTSKSIEREDDFEIQGPVINNMKLYSGDFNFTFESNYTTEYVVEDDDALYPNNYFEKYQFDTTDGPSYMLITNGSGETSEAISELTDGNTIPLNLQSDNNGLLNVTICASFSGVTGLGRANYDRTNILGLMLDFTYNINIDANFTVKMRNFYGNGEWQKVIDTVEIKGESTAPPYNETNEIIVNKNLNFINDTDYVLVQFIFNRSDLTPFNAKFLEFDLNALMVFELDITEDDRVALEFDLRGESTTINGFYAWIRTIDLDEAINTELNITLYRANTTIERTEQNLLDETLKPELSQKIDEIILNFASSNYYTDDGLHYFAFDTAYTADLSRYNYFIVIKSDRSDKVIFRLVTLPWYNYGDSETDHQLKTSNDGGDSWTNAKKKIGITTYEQLDASLFKLNITRGFMPSDFNDTLKIQNTLINNFNIVFENEPILTWGLGKWNNIFDSYIDNDGSYKFTVSLTWDTDLISRFKFDVNYTAQAYKEKGIKTYYKVVFDELPQWTFNYTLNLDDFESYDEWSFTQFWYIFPDYYDPLNLTTPDPYNEQILSETGGTTSLTDKENYEKVVITTKIINVSQSEKYSGTYSLNLTCPNVIDDMHSYINYEGILWETQGFMFGDDISVSVDIQYNNLAPKEGPLVYANVSLFFPNGTKYPGKDLVSPIGEISSDNSILFYDFDNVTILGLTDAIPTFGEYYLGYFWTNGSLIGCKKMAIYIDTYNVEFNDFEYIEEYVELGFPPNRFTAKVDWIEGVNSYTFLVATINKATPPPNYRAVNLSVNEEFNYEEGFDQFPVLMKTFIQNETILSPQEKVNITVTLQNIANDPPISPLKAKISVKLVSLANEEWIIDETTSISKELKYYGSSEDTQEFNVELEIPELQPDNIWKGMNAPLRKGGVKTVVTVYIKGTNVGSYSSDEYSLLINQTEDEFKGYIIELKSFENVGQNIDVGFERDECSYLPDYTTFLVNIYDYNYVSSYNQINFTDPNGLELDSYFSTPIVNPGNPKNGDKFEVSSRLTTEFGEKLQNKQVTYQYKSDGSWVTLGTQSTNQNGNVNIEIDTKKINVGKYLQIKLIWSGEVGILGTSDTFTIPIETEENKLSVSFDYDYSFIYRNTNTALKIELKNTGVSTLKITEIDIEFEEKDLDYEIEEKNDALLDQLPPGESTDIIIVVEVPNLDLNELKIIVIVEAENEATGESLTEKDKITLDVLDKPLINYAIEYSYIIILALILLVFVFASFYAKKIKKKIEIPLKEPVKKRPRRGRYVKVTELKAKKEEKEIEAIKEVKPEIVEPEIVEPEIVEPKMAESQPKTDLDTLLEKEYLKKAKKTSKKVKKPPKKAKEKIAKEVIKPPRRIKRAGPTPISTKKMVEQKKKKKIKKKKEKAKKLKTKGKVPKKKVKPKKKTTDLDSLLKEKGLDD